MAGCGFIRRFCGLRVNQTSPGLRGIERPTLSTTEMVCSSENKGGCTLRQFIRFPS